MSPSSINAGVLTGLFFHKSYTYSHSSYEFCVRSVSFKEQHLYIYLKKSFFFLRSKQVTFSFSVSFSVPWEGSNELLNSVFSVCD